MDKKQIVNQFNNQKGVTAGDIIIALMIILTSLGVIVMAYTNLVTNARGIDRKTGATRIATNILENMEQFYYDDLVEKFDSNGKFIGNINNFNTTIPSGYNVEITSEKPQNVAFDTVRNVTVKVSYKLDGIEQNLTLGQVFEREIVRECNSPKFDGEYLNQLVPSGNFVMAGAEAEGVASDVSIICPIKFNGTDYEIITEPSELKQMWYSYSNKEWARVLILNSTEYAECLDDASLIEEKLIGDNSYIWIPRFGVKAGEDLLGGTHFKFKTTETAILKKNENNLIYNYLENITWSTANITSFDSENKQLGIWMLYSEIENTTSDAYKLNQSQYGPLTEH